MLINDLHTAVAKDIDRYIAEDTLHLSQEGIEFCAGMVADAIKAAAKTLPALKQTEEREAAPAGAPVLL